MRNYRSIFRCCMGISIILFIVLLMMHVKGVDVSQEGSFWVNIILGVFGSFLVAAATAFMSYWVDRKRTLESFSKNTKKILHSLRKYDFEWDEDKKIQFLRDFSEEDREAWDAAYTDICFISEGRTPNSDHVYIYEKIYKPIQDLVMMVDSFVRDLNAAHKGILTDLNVKERLKVIEESLAPYAEYDTEFEKGKITHCSGRWDYLTVRIQEELNGRYYSIMYPGKKGECDPDSFVKTEQMEDNKKEQAEINLKVSFVAGIAATLASGYDALSCLFSIPWLFSWVIAVPVAVMLYFAHCRDRMKWLLGKPRLEKYGAILTIFSVFVFVFEKAFLVLIDRVSSFEKKYFSLWFFTIFLLCIYALWLCLDPLDDLKRLYRKFLEKLDALMHKRKYIISDKMNKPVPFYRGSNLSFSPDKSMHHFSSYCQVAAEYSPPLKRCFIWMKNPLIVDFENHLYEYSLIADVTFYPRSFSEVCKEYYTMHFDQNEENVLVDTVYISLCAKENGYDGVIFLNIYESTFNYPSCDVTVFSKANLLNIRTITEAEANRIIKAEQTEGYDSSVDP